MASRSRFRGIFFWLVLGLLPGSPQAEVVIVVSPQSPINSVSKNLLVDIFLGRASRYPDGSRVDPIDHVEGSADRDEFYRELIHKSPEQLKAYWSRIIFTGKGRPPREIANVEDLIRRLNKNPHSITYIQAKLVDDRVKVLDLE